MADKDLQERIIKFLNSKPKKKEAVTKITQALRVPKKSFNSEIYKLQCEGRVVKCVESPPVWGLPSGAVTSIPVSTRRSKRISTDISISGKRDDAGFRCKILNYLEKKSKPSKSLDIAKGTGHTRAADVNTVLYSMMKDGLIKRVSEKPPMWDVVTGASSHYSQGEAAIEFDAPAESQTLDNLISGGQGVPAFQETELFQDTELFKTEPHVEYETPEVYSCVKKENEAFGTNEHGHVVIYSPIKDDMVDTTQGSYDLFEKYVDKNIPEGTGTYDDDDIECDGDTFDRQEHSSEQRMDTLSPGRKFSNLKEENSDEMVGCAANLGEDNENDNDCAKKHAIDIESSEYDGLKKPKSFRDFFKLDDPTSDDTSSSLDSVKEVETEQSLEGDSPVCSSVESYPLSKSSNIESQCTPDLSDKSSVANTPEQRKVQSELNTPRILDLVLEMSDSPVTSTTRQTQKSVDALGSTVSLMSTEHELEVKDEIGQVEMEEGASGDQMDIDSEMTSEVQPDTKSDYYGMEDCDKVLKVLLELKAIAQFVLKRKTDIPPEKLDEVLQKCLSLKYVSGSSKFWKITDEGVTYISKKTGESNDDKEHERNIQVERKVKPTFQGPPPPPMAILNKGSSSGGNKRVEHSSQNMRPLTEATFTSHSPNSLFKPPQVQKSNSSSYTEVSQNSGPQSLMSIQFDSNPLLRTEQRNRLNQESVSQEKPQPLMSVQLGSKSINKSQLVSPQNQKRNISSSMSTSEQNLELNSNLWETSSSTNSSNVNDNYPKSQSLGQAIPMSEHFPRSGQPTSTRQIPQGSQQPTLSQNAKRTTPETQEITKRVIPTKYADYPNQSTSMQSLKSKTQSKSADRPGNNNLSKSAFNKGPPPSPLDILSKGIKKTEISPPSSYKDTSFVQTVSQNHLIGKNMEYSVNKSILKQSGSLFGNENIQTVMQKSDQVRMQSSARSLSCIPAGKGPPAPPAVKLGLQVVQSKPTTIPTQAQYKPTPNLGLVLNNESFNALNKNPVSALMEYAQSRKMVATVEVLNRKGSSHKPTFEMAAFVGKRKFPSINCNNKKEGRKEACDIALRQLVAEGQFQAENAASNTSSIAPVPSANMTHFDTMAALTHRGFTALVSQITTESFAGRKVIAGLVMKRSPDDVGVLISLGTGNRCITGQQLSLQGNTVNDSHAEIITRRGFLRFLYKRLLEFDPNKPHPMLEKSPRGRLQIRPNITFHLYISTAPCGDGALFSPRDAESSKAPLDARVRAPHEPTFSSNVQGLLRTKVEGGEGTIPVEPGFKVQTFDGIQRGERLRTMSCTDKVCRWNVVGMQGALLSHFLEPIYLDSLTLGLLYDHGHLCRAVCCRVGRGTVDVNSELPSGFRLNHPWLGRVTACDPPREVQKTKALSINWCFGDNAPEVTDGTQGLCYTSIEKGFFSRCSKRNLFTSFKSLCEKFGRQDLLSMSSYNEAKMTAQDFVAAKQTMLRRFKENGFGKWVSKPVEEEMFQYDEH